ncbi:DUF4148 domain-containing protein [Paraburkholderia phymatum]|uniref:Purine nucleoside phosphorylase n=1 Tax=Paraburkholderia phymatum (strain DSM 17167 / CIP 108236 / LMG 21445 / STM815) TaxID=391038 RepID=B2JUP2_PARP8|nr:DUF4148 domain-containing protein [Paraburkholderia phymatum]ACC76213.1 conserved hypothetical protein [Paraburkholderia phymatum STM815]
MKALIQAVVVSCALAAPALSFAQAEQGQVTRAQVREDLQRVEQAGYRPSSDDASYPADIQAAEAKASAGGQQPLEQTAVGGVAPSGTMQMGAPASADGNPKPVFFGN